MHTAFRLPLLAVTAAALALPAGAAADPAEFSSAGEFQVGNTPFDLVVADFDGDDVPDVATPDVNGDTVTVLLGDGDGTFTEAAGSPLAVGDGPRGLAAADFDGDSDVDLAVSLNNADAVSVLSNDGQAGFVSASTTGIPDAGAIDVGNLDGDADPDLAVTTSTAEGGLWVLLGTTGASFSATGGSPEATGSFPRSVVIGNFDGTSGDVAVGNAESDSVGIHLGVANGDLAPATSETVGDGPGALAAANLDAGPTQDLATANNFSDNISILLGSGTGDFTAPVSSPEAEGDNSITAADFDGDGDTDLASAQGNDQVVAILNDGTANFSPAAQGPVGVLGIPGQVASADLDDDDDVDLLVAGGNGGYYAVTALLNDEADADDDDVGDVADACPEVADGPNPPDGSGCPAFYRTVTLRYAPRAKAFKGRVTGDEPTCVGRGQAVRLIQRKDGGEESVKGDTTNPRGKFKLRHKAKRGRFYARVAESLDPDVGRCAEAQSPEVRP